jgi:hypothetical protein
LAVTDRLSERTVTPDPLCSIRLTGAFRSTRLPSRAAIRSGTSCAPPAKRCSWAPSFVLKLRSKVPWFCSLPDAAM